MIKKMFTYKSIDNFQDVIITAIEFIKNINIFKVYYQFDDANIKNKYRKTFKEIYVKDTIFNHCDEKTTKNLFLMFMKIQNSKPRNKRYKIYKEGLEIQMIKYFKKRLQIIKVRRENENINPITTISTKVKKKGKIKHRIWGLKDEHYNRIKSQEKSYFCNYEHFERIYLMLQDKEYLFNLKDYEKY